MKRFKLQNTNGFATLIALIMVGMLTLIGLAAMMNSDTDVSLAGNSLHEMRAFYAAEAGLEKAVSQVQEAYSAGGVAPDTMPEGQDTLNDCQVEYSAADDGPAVAQRLTEGNLAGLHALVKTYTITSTGTSNSENGRVIMTQNFQANMVPIFQFAIFYDDELWASPAEEFVIKGRVHSNSDICLQASKGLKIDGMVTSAGNIQHGYKYGIQSGTNGDVSFKNASGAYVSMKQGSTWIDSKYKDWYTEASKLWDGRVRDQAFGQEKLNVPISNQGSPRKLIEPAAGNPDSYENKATLKYIEGKAFQKVSGAWVDVTSDLTAKGVITASADKFYDAREKKNVDVVDLDIAKLYSTGYGPSNGVIFFSDTNSSSSEWKALRMKNGSTLNAGLTVASNNPVYTMGNFNTNSKKPAAILSDVLTILSSNWDDTKGTKSTSSRPAVSTTLNASFITGDDYLGAGNYNGGVSNLPRYLEDWGSTRTAKILGSIVNLWESKYATSAWSTDYYEPPARDYAYDTDLDDPSKMPPETPKVLVFQRTGWAQEYVGIGEE